MTKDNKNIGFISLGCPKALVDSERILTQLRAEGYDISGSYDNADLIIINTCGFIDAAIEESLETIAEALDKNGTVIVTGCLGNTAVDIKQHYPGVLAVTGPHAYEEVMQAVHSHCPPPESSIADLIPPQGIKLTPPHYAYLKISEGCNNSCSFCIIPDIRGKLVSRPIGDVLQEAQNLVDSGVRELLVIAQDTSAYGSDFRYQTSFWNGRPIKSNIQQLCEHLGEMGIWIRLHYLYPYPHVDKLVQLMSDGLVLPYLDIPLQHSSPEILKSMKRPGNTERMLERINLWREICPDITLRSTFITGFPGETERDFEHLLNFLKQAKLNRVGCFTYSEVEGAQANLLDQHIPEEVKKARYDELMQAQLEISQALLQQQCGKTITVLTDTCSDGNTIARTMGDAPEIDGVVIIENSSIKAGEFVEVTIKKSTEYDLIATLNQ